jgi:hypothetical protein
MRTGIGSIVASAVAAVCSAAALAGCGSIGDAQQVIDRSRLVNDLASRLDHASELTYTAEYQLPGGEHASIAQAQDPVRVAYTYSGGKYATTKDATIDCGTTSTGLTCTLTAPPARIAGPPTDLQHRMIEHGLAPPANVVGLLTAASLSSNAVIQQHDTTIAGEHATCVEVSGVENSDASQFDACITATGVLGSFKGAIGGKAMEVSLIRYLPSVAENAFDPPADAKIVDQRPSQ